MHLARSAFVKGFGCRPDHDGGADRAGRRRKASRGGNRGPTWATVEVVAVLWGFWVWAGGCVVLLVTVARTPDSPGECRGAARAR